MICRPALLFCPADRPDRYQKALDAADAVILDLEDGVKPADRPRARASLIGTPLNPDRVVVRVNSSRSDDFASDLEALRATPYRRVMLAKTECDDDLELLSGFEVIALCETAAGVVNAVPIARSPGVVGLMWGAEDLVLSLGGTSSRRPTDGTYRDFARHARSEILLAAKSAGKAAIDAVHLDISDVAGLEREAEDAVASGFDAFACIHPSQVGVVRSAYSPASDRIAWAHRVMREAAGAPGVFRLDEQMIDEVVLAQAQRILQRTRSN